MTPTPPTPRAKLARARVMVADLDPEYCAAVAFQVYPSNSDRGRADELPLIHVAVIPCPTRAQAARIARVANMTEGQREVHVARHMAACFCKVEPEEVGGCEITAYREATRAVLSALGLASGGKA